MNNELQSRCLSLAAELAAEMNGDLFYVPQEDVDSVMAGLSEANLQEAAEELAHLAAWFN